MDVDILCPAVAAAAEPSAVSAASIAAAAEPTAVAAAAVAAAVAAAEPAAVAAAARLVRLLVRPPPPRPSRLLCLPRLLDAV